MPKYEFRMLCMNNKVSCNNVKLLMDDFTNIQDVNMVDFDHVGIRTFKTKEDALNRLYEIRRDAGDDLLESGIFMLDSK